MKNALKSLMICWSKLLKKSMIIAELSLTFWLIKTWKKNGLCAKEKTVKAKPLKVNLSNTIILKIIIIAFQFSDYKRVELLDSSTTCSSFIGCLNLTIFHFSSISIFKFIFFIALCLLKCWNWNPISSTFNHT